VKVVKYFCSALVLLAPLWASAGWVPQNSGTGVTLYSVHFPVDAQTGYAVGWSGTILKTTDGGANWVSQTSGFPSSFLYAVHFPVDASTGYVVGENMNLRVILKTTNGGAVWDSLYSPINEGIYLRSVHFPVGAQTGYIAGDNGTILKTMNGGANWTVQTSDTTGWLSSIHFPVDAQTGYAVGAVFLSGNVIGLIKKTINGGGAWSSQTLGAPRYLCSVHFPLDASTGYAVGDSGAILKTTDEGATWVSQTSGTTELLRSVHFPVDALTGYSVGYGIRKTTNGGANWVYQAYGDLYSIHFPVDALTGYAVGSGGTILKTTDGGVGVEETAEGRGQRLEVRITAKPNPFTSFAILPGHERERFSLYDVSGRKVGTYRGDRVGEGLAPGVYFLKYQEMLKQVQHDEILRIVKVR